MKFALLSLAVLGAAIGAGGCASSGEYEENPVIHAVTPEDKAATQSKVPLASDAALLYVNGLGCPLCATNIDKQLLRMDGVKTATVNLADGTVLVTMTGGRRPSPHDFSEKVLDAGFTLVKVEPR